MDQRIILLYYLCSIAGLVMVVGGIWLIYKEKIIIDKETKQVIEVEIPFFGKIKTNIPALALFIFGFAGLIYPIIQSRGFAQQLRITGDVETDTFPMTIYAIVELDTLQNNRRFSLTVPFLKEVTKEYRVLYLAQNLVEEEFADAQQTQSGEIRLPMKKISAGVAETFEPNPIPPVPDEFSAAGGKKP